MKRVIWLLTRVSRQRVVGRRPAGQSKALWSLAAGASPARALRRFDLGAELGPDDPEQHDGGGLLATLLIRVGDFLGVGRKVGQAAWWNKHRERDRVGNTARAVSRIESVLWEDNTSLLYLPHG